MTTHSLARPGCPIAFDVEGRGPLVLLIQGVGTCGSGWRPQIEALRDRHTCVSFDNRGIGRSTPLARSLAFDDMVDDARAILDHLSLGPAHVVGHSLGGLIAQGLALKAREQVRSLALLCTFARGRDAAPPTWRMISAGARSRIGTRNMRRRGFAELLLPPGAVELSDIESVNARFAPLFGHDLADQPRIVSEQLAVMRRAEAESRLPALDGIPTLVVSARHDPIAPPSLGRRIAAGIPGARFAEIEDASHGLPLHRPQVVDTLLAEHFERRD